MCHAKDFLHPYCQNRASVSFAANIKWTVCLYLLIDQSLYRKSNNPAGSFPSWLSHRFTVLCQSFGWLSQLSIWSLVLVLNVLFQRVFLSKVNDWFSVLLKSAYHHCDCSGMESGSPLRIKTSMAAYEERLYPGAAGGILLKMPHWI